MTMAMLAPFGAVAATGFLVWLAYFLGYRGARRFETEADFLALCTPYGGARQHLLDSGGVSGIALVGNGQVLVAKFVGDRVATRVFSPSAIVSLVGKHTKPGQDLAIKLHFKDFGFSTVALKTSLRAMPGWLDHLQSRGAAQ